jgi:hypothetical protein
MKIEIIKGDNNAVTDFFSSPSNTPETDDQPIYAMNDNGYQVPCVDLEFARKLERERDEAIFDKNTSAADFLKQIQHITLCKDVAREKILMAEKIRDETRKQFVDFVDQTEDYKRERDEWAAMCGRYKQERDEARQQLRIAVGLLSTHPQFADKHPEDVLAFVKEGAK